MAQNGEMIEALNDLIIINNDRIEGYEKAHDEANELENDLRAWFKKLADQSRDNVREISAEVVSLGGEPATGTMVTGKLYRIWMDIRTIFNSDNRRAVLENAEGGEDAARQAYDEALRSMEFPEDIHQMLLKQQQAIHASYNDIKQERDRQRDVSKYPLTT